MVVAEFELNSAFSGAPNYLHGGVCLTIMDEAMAWATIAIAHTFALTRRTSTMFEHPIRVGRPYRVEARVDAVESDRIKTSAVIVDQKDRSCATSQAEFIPLGPVQAADAIGQEPTGPDVTYLQPRP